MRKFMRPAPPAEPAPSHRQPPYTNGHASGAAARDGRLSALSRYSAPTTQEAYWRGSEQSLFEDVQFPATWRALGSKRLAAGVRWMRPHELCVAPRYYGDERAPPPSSRSTSGGGGGEGDTGSDTAPEDDSPAATLHHDEDLDRWHVETGTSFALAGGGEGVCVAAAALSLAPRLLRRAVPPHSFARHYSGAFRFRFWVFGSWREVVVDDRLPTRGGRPACAHSRRRDDFTLALLHKAYAKLHGSFAALAGGGVARALQDLSGAIVQSFDTRRQPHALTYQVLNSAVPRSTLLVGTVGTVSGRREAGGLADGQAYCVTGLARVREAGGGGGTALVRVRAVSARGTWEGAWAPHSAERLALAPRDDELLETRAPHPGDFWMSFADFASSFASLELVHVGPDDWLREPALHSRRPWRAVLARRRWRYGYNAGGPPSCTETTGTNPQFHVQIPARCHVVVSVTQQYEARGGRRLRAIGFCVYELPGGASPRRDLHPLRGLRALDVTHECRAREVVTFFTLAAGAYLVVPHTRRAHAPGAFLLRVLTDVPAHVWELNEDNVVVRDLPAELAAEPRLVPGGAGAGAGSLDAGGMRAALRRGGAWRAGLLAPPSPALCRALVALRDPALAGAVRAHELPALLALLAQWRAAFERVGAVRRVGCTRAPLASSYRLRALLWACGLTASNKVLECLVVRYARRARLSMDAFAEALARLLLAHERFRALDTRVKANPLTLEEMILMTIYT